MSNTSIGTGIYRVFQTIAASAIIAMFVGGLKAYNIIIQLPEKQAQTESSLKSLEQSIKNESESRQSEDQKLKRNIDFNYNNYYNDYGKSHIKYQPFVE